jgi:hypothetical protein
MLDAVSGGELDHMQKNDLNLSEEAIAYCREIWPKA